jgi:predicted RND superfamily exporter protein
MMQMIQHELFLFIILSILIAAAILYLFFRSFRVVLSSLVVVAISIVFTLGYIGLMGYKISILTGVIPSLIVVIAIENVIYILNKYHWEYRNHGNKIRALSRVIQRIGFASLMVNTATALGFATFILVSNQLLREFGLIASISILTEYLLCITLIPIIFSYLNPPKEKHVKHLDNNFFNTILEKIIHVIQNHRKWIFLGMVLIVIVGIIGMFNMQTSGKVVDDISENSTIYKDLKFFEHEFGGVMPFEISIETQKKKGVIQAATLQKIDQFQDSVLSLGGFSKPLSLVEFLKFAKQAYYNGSPGSFSLPNKMERNFVLAYLPQESGQNNNLLNSFIDSDQQRTRISFQMEDAGTKEVNSLVKKSTAFADSIFPKDQYNVVITGNSVVYAKGTEFLIKHLVISVVLAIIFISILMALMFSSIRMIAVSMIPNIIPLIITAAIMGFSGVPIKPSTIIVFSIALGISVDNTIQYLSRYRHELKITGGNIKLSTLNALREAGFSMMYTSVVLVLGFSVFMISEFGGTKALGMLVSATLFIAMFFNMLVLPSLLLVLDKYVVTKSFESEPIIEIYEDDESDGTVRKEKLNGE